MQFDAVSVTLLPLTTYIFSDGRDSEDGLWVEYTVVKGECRYTFQSSNAALWFVSVVEVYYTTEWTNKHERERFVLYRKAIHIN